jgi:hypothetical protein
MYCTLLFKFQLNTYYCTTTYEYCTQYWSLHPLPTTLSTTPSLYTHASVLRVLEYYCTSTVQLTNRVRKYYCSYKVQYIQRTRRTVW